MVATKVKTVEIKKVCIHKARSGGYVEVMLLGAASSKNVLLRVAKNKRKKKEKRLLRDFPGEKGECLRVCNKYLCC